MSDAICWLIFDQFLEIIFFLFSLGFDDLLLVGLDFTELNVKEVSYLSQKFFVR
jgi:hypothetical protein